MTTETKVTHAMGKIAIEIAERADFPIRLQTDDGWRIAQCSGISVGIDKDKARANARRLAAAWNACEGIPTEALEAGAVAGLLAALREVAHHADDGYGFMIDVELAMAKAEGREPSLPK